MDSFSGTWRDEVATSVSPARIVGITGVVPAANPTKTGEPLENLPSRKIILWKSETLPVEDTRVCLCSRHFSGSWPTVAVNS
jgi:hypothetical protein